MAIAESVLQISPGAEVDLYAVQHGRCAKVAIAFVVGNGDAGNPFFVPRSCTEVYSNRLVDFYSGGRATFVHVCSENTVCVRDIRLVSRAALNESYEHRALCLGNWPWPESPASLMDVENACSHGRPFIWNSSFVARFNHPFDALSRQQRSIVWNQDESEKFDVPASSSRSFLIERNLSKTARFMRKGLRVTYVYVSLRQMVLTEDMELYPGFGDKMKRLTTCIYRAGGYDPRIGHISIALELSAFGEEKRQRLVSSYINGYHFRDGIHPYKASCVLNEDARAWVLDGRFRVLCLRKLAEQKIRGISASEERNDMRNMNAEDHIPVVLYYSTSNKEMRVDERLRIGSLLNAADHGSYIGPHGGSLETFEAHLDF